MTHFNRDGIDVLVERHGGGQPKRYTEAERERILQEARRTPDRNHDGTATWSLTTLQRALRQAPDGLPTVSTYTIWCVLRDADFVWTKDQTPLRLLLVWDNLTGHYTIDLILWLFAHGIMPLFTPLGGSYLNMAESVQRILKRRALDGHHPKTPEEIMEWLEAAARGWNREPTPFEWGGKRRARRQRA